MTPQKFLQNWQQNAADFGQIPWERSDDFRYYIEARLPAKAATELVTKRSNFIAENNLKATHLIAAEDMHITLALPGRLGTHFQQNDLSYMQKVLAALTQKQDPIMIEIKDFNVFPNVLFAEVLDISGALQKLHETICQQIPFSQYPEYQYEHYLPHVSLAYGAAAQDLSQVNRTQAATSCELTEIVLGKVKVGGPGETDREVISRYPLAWLNSCYSSITTTVLRIT